MHGERNNNSTEELKALLGPQLLNQRSNSQAWESWHPRVDCFPPGIQWNLYPPALSIRVSPGVFKRLITSCPRTLGKHSAMESCWASSRPCKHLVMTRGERVPTASWALLSSFSRVKTRALPRPPPGGHGKILHWRDLCDQIGQRLLFKDIYLKVCLCKAFIFFCERIFLILFQEIQLLHVLQIICLLWRHIKLLLVST